MKHVDTWLQIAKKNIALALILEDDAVFVPFFREKFDRTVYTALRTGVLKIDPYHCAPVTQTRVNWTAEWVNQDPVLMIGSCFDMKDAAFQASKSNASPMLSAHKLYSSRCSHGYLVTACSARALIRQIHVKKNAFRPSDYLLNKLVATSPTLQVFWLDPPIVYQGNMVEDRDGIPSFNRTTYRK